MQVIQIFLFCFCTFCLLAFWFEGPVFKCDLDQACKNHWCLWAILSQEIWCWAAQFEKYIEMTVEYMMGVIRRNLLQGWFYSHHSFTRAKAAGSCIVLNLRKFRATLFLLNRVYLLDVKSDWKNAHLNSCCLPQDNETGTALNESLILKTKIQALSFKEQLPRYFLDVTQAPYFSQLIFHVWSLLTCLTLHKSNSLK